MATLTTNWTNIASGSYTNNGATLTYYIDAKLNSQSVANNTSSISTRARTVFSGYSMSSYNVHMSCTGCTPYDGNNSTLYTFSTKTVLSGSTTVSHSADGTGTLSMSGACTGNLGMNIQLSGSISLPTIPRASKPTFDKTTVVLDGSDSIVISTNRASSSFTHTLKITVGDNTATFTDVGASMTFAPTPSIWMPYMSSYEMTATVACTTYSGSTQIGSQQTSTFTMKVDTATYKPTIGTVTKSDTNTTTSALETSGSFIKGYSNLSLTVAFGINDTGYDSALASAKITIGGVSQTYSLSGTSGSASFTANAITDSTVVIEVTDNRGYKVTQNVALTMVDYSPVTISSVKGERVNQSGTPSETGDYIKYTVECNVFKGTFGQVSNELRLYTYSKLASASDYGSAVLEQTVTPSGSNANDSYTFTGITVGTYSASSQYDIRFRVGDKLSYKISPAVRINEGIPVYAWGEDHFDVYGTFHIHDRDDITKYISLDGLNPSTETVSFSGAVGGSVTWKVFKYGALRIAVSKWRCASNATISSGWNGLYTSPSLNTPDFPLTFTSVDYSHITYVAADANARYSADCWMSIQSNVGETGGISGTNAGTVFLVRPDSGVTIGHPVFTQIVIGTV